MLLDSTNPITARARFRSRPAVCFAGFIILSLGLVVVASWVLSVFYPSLIAMLAADVGVIAICYFLYSQWHDQPIRVRCDACRKTLLSNTPWVCGFCKQTNRNANDFPFVHRCGHCKDEAKAYRCHHCSELIFLTDDQDKNNYAYSVNAPSELPEPDEHREKLKKLWASKEVKEARLSNAQVDAELLALRNRLKLQKPKKKSARDVLQAGLDSRMEREQAAQELEAAIKSQYKGNPRLMKRMLAALKHEVNDSLPEH